MGRVAAAFVVAVIAIAAVSAARDLTDDVPPMRRLLQDAATSASAMTQAAQAGKSAQEIAASLGAPPTKPDTPTAAQATAGASASAMVAGMPSSVGSMPSSGFPFMPTYPGFHWTLVPDSCQYYKTAVKQFVMSAPFPEPWKSATAYMLDVYWWC